jgi:hypothetical protein
MKSLILPTNEEVSELIERIVSHLNQDGDWLDGLDLTIATNGEANDCDTADWTFQTGDNSYSGSCYHYRHWAVTTVYRDTNPSETATELINQLDESFFE